MVDSNDELIEDADLTADLEDPDLEELPDDEVIDDDDLDDDDDVADVDDVDDVDDDEVDVALVDDHPLIAPVAAPPASTDDDDDDDDEDEADEDDVEASLDVILKEKLVVADEEEEDGETPDAEERTEVTTKVLPKQPDEFVCQSCFLVKHPSQLADGTRMLCRDCV